MAAPPLLSARGVSKRYALTQALDHVSFEVTPGEIHGLLGHNGSGKSTLIKVLAGVEEPDTGHLEVRGEPVGLPLKPADAERLGLRFVHQNLGLLPTLSVAENLLLKRFVPPGRGFTNPLGGHVDWKRLRADASRLLRDHGLDVDPRRPLRELSASRQAQIAIIRAVAGAGGDLGSGCLLVLDEPTVFLPRQQVSDLFALLRRLTRNGIGVVLVSHRMDEVLEHTDRVTVLRDGRTVKTLTTAETAEDELVAAIIGQAHLRMAAPAPRPEMNRSEVLVRAREVRTGRLTGIDLDVAAGEIVGLTGLIGSGYEQLLYAMFGATEGAEGLMEVAEKEIDLSTLSPGEAMAHRIGLVPADRARQGLGPALSVEENLTMTSLGEFFSGGRLRVRALTLSAIEAISAYRVRPAEPRKPSGQLSGGNQQKVVVAKWLRRRPLVLLLHEPTQGVDVSSREEIWGFVRELAASGTAVLCASTDDEELVSLCGRVEVFSGGRISHTLRGSAVTKENISSATLSARAAPRRSA